MAEENIRLGSVIVFKEGVTREEAAKALMAIGEVLDLNNRNSFAECLNKVRSFNEDYGGPVWYIP